MRPYAMKRLNGLYIPAGGGGGGGGGGGTTNSDYGRDIRVWMRQPVGVGSEAYANGGTLYLPDGTDYYGGDLGDVRGSAYVRPYNASLPNNGWLTLKSANPGGVTVDLGLTAGSTSITNYLDGGGLGHGNFTSPNGFGSFRLAFDDIFFDNGVVQFVGGDRVRFWRCPRRFTFEQWKAQFDAACVQMGVTIVTTIPDNTTYQAVHNNNYLKRNGNPTGYRFNEGIVSGVHTQCTNMWVYSCDIHDVADDGIYWGESSYCRAVGDRIWNVKNHYADGSTGGSGPSNWFHNDSVQWNGEEISNYVTDSMLGQHVELSAESGNITGARLDRIWQCDSSIVGMSLNANPGRVFVSGNIGGTGKEYYWFANGTGFPSDSGWDIAVSDTGTTSGISKNFIHITDATLASMGFTLTDGADGQKFLANISQVVAHASNPANIWRATNTDRDTVWAGTYD